MKKSQEKFSMMKLKAISMILSVGTPSATMIILNESLANSPAGAISIVGVIVILISALIMKDKIAENFKMPSCSIYCTFCNNSIVGKYNSSC